jgi:hypothetical protein
VGRFPYRRIPIRKTLDETQNIPTVPTNSVIHVAAISQSGGSLIVKRNSIKLGVKNGMNETTLVSKWSGF